MKASVLAIEKKSGRSAPKSLTDDVNRLATRNRQGVEPKTSEGHSGLMDELANGAKSVEDIDSAMSRYSSP